MTVKELIKKLQDLGPEAQDVKVGYWRYSLFNTTNPRYKFMEYLSISYEESPEQEKTVGLWTYAEEIK